jgi:CheY-like chemotaxis protein
MSHEIRTPMNAIIGFSNLLKSAEVEEEKKQEYLDIIMASGNKLIFLIDNLINIAKIESNQYEITKNLFNIIELFNELKDRFKRSDKLKRNNIDFNFEIKEDSIMVFSDITLLSQILSNLIINAIKYTAEGYIKITYKLLNNDILEISIQDSGCGISEEDMKIIFEKFRRVNDKKGYTPNGSGLGLALSKGFIELLGGRLEVESKVDFGSIFKLILPINVDGQKNMHSPAIKVAKPLPKAKNVLVVEDDKNSSDYLNLLIKNKYKGVNVINAYNGKEALKLYNQHSDALSLILLDLRLPKISGYQVLKEIRSKDEEIKIVIQSANAMNDHVGNCINIGCDGYLSKPIVVDNFYKKLDEYLL